MIKVERTACPSSLVPVDPDAAGPKELRKLKDKLARGETLKSDDFNAYGARKVRVALQEMFHGKCAYCESKIAGSQDTDVEHYRPKKGVTEAKEAGIDHPGYWWLAMDWDNLVLSCKHCNQSRSYHIIIPEDLETEEELEVFLENARVTSAGKLNAFPTLNDFWVTAPEQDVAHEQPLILNPVDMEPEEHLDWVLFRGGATVRAKQNSAVGEATCRILGLNRRWLEENRRIHLLEMREDRNDIISDINAWLEATDAVQQARWEARAQRSISRLVSKTEPEQPYSGLARAFLARVQQEVADMQA